MDWNALGIDPTKDTEEITRAYREQLPKANPEERPEAFKALRAAYEEALRLATEEERPDAEKTPVERWIDRVEQTYDDLSLRTSPEAWETLLADDVVRGLDTRPQAEEELLRFLMSCYYLPQEIWQLLGHHFDWEARAAELRETFPADFITFAVLVGMRTGERLPLVLFTPGRDGHAADRYINLYKDAINGEDDKRVEAMDGMRACPEQHPYGTFLLLENDLARAGDGSDEAARILDEMQDLLAGYPGDEHLTLEMAIVHLSRQEFAEAETLANEVLARDPSSARGLRIVAEAMANQGRYADAVEKLHDLMGLMDGNQSQLYQLNGIRKKWNEALISQYEARLAEDPDDMQNRFDLAWCYLQNDRGEEAFDLAQPLPEGFPDAFGYHNLFSNLYLVRNEYDKALPHEDALIQTIRDMQPDGTEKTAKRLARLSEMMVRRAGTLQELGRSDEAAAGLEEALAMDPNDTEIITYCGKVHFAAKHYERTLAMADRLVELVPNSYHGYLMQAMAHYELGNDGAAYEAVNNAIDADPSDLVEYHIKLLLLTRNNLTEEAQALADYLKGEGFAEDLTVQWCEARLVKDEEGSVANTLAAHRALEAKLDALPKGDLPRWTADFYHHLTELMADDKDSREDYSRDDLLGTLDKGLAYDSEHHDSLSYKAWLLKKENRDDEAIAIFTRLFEKPHRGIFAEKHLAELYYRDLKRKAPEALKYYKILLENNDEDGDLDFYAGMCNYRMRNLPEAAEHFLAEQRKAPDDIDGYYRLAYVYLMMGRPDDALAQADKTIELAKADTDSKDSSKFWHPKEIILRRMGRPEEAVAALRECRQYNPDRTCYKSIFETYLQFGMFDSCEAVIKEWKSDKLGKKDIAGYGYADLILSIMRHKFAKARQDMAWKYETSLDYDDKVWAKCMLDTQLGKTKLAAKHMHGLVENARKDDRLSSYQLSKYALALWADGQLDEARKIAEEELKELDERVTEYTSYLPLYLTRRVQALAILGRFDEAQADLNAARALPLCEDCAFARCKDADVFECRLHAMAGYLKEALALCRQLMQTWPGEEELVYLESILAAKGVR